MQRLRIANGREVACECTPGSEEFRNWMDNGGPALLGTMHVGASDTMGFQLARRARSPICLVRRRVMNSHDTEALERMCGESLKIIWVNDPADFLFSLKEAAACNRTIAIQCDRLDPGVRTGAFEFLGARRLFPVSIYHLAIILERPVLLSFGIQTRDGTSQLHASPLLQRKAGESKEEYLRRAHAHFQAFLRQLEGHLRTTPWDWFNFTPLNPVASEEESIPA